MRLGYIQRLDKKLNPNLEKEFVFREAPFSRRISSRGDKVYCKMFSAFDYEEIELNTEILKKSQGIMLVQEPFILDDELRARAVNWVNYANNADPSEIDPFYSTENKE